ncbi:MAG: energy transducer TonB [Methylophaga sp.]|nr:MAG: energy transducer TonB [Methylophaga sp.]
MFIDYLRQSFLAAAITLLPGQLILADVYKWVDENGETHYSQLKPKSQQADLIKAPPPPAIDPKLAQERLDELIHQQQADEKTKIEQKLKSDFAADNAEKQQQNCASAKKGLQQYQDYSRTKEVDADGNMIRISEQHRQQKIQQHQNDVKTHCQ